MNNRIIKVTRNSCFFMIIRTMEDIDEKVVEELNKKYSKYELGLDDDKYVKNFKTRFYYLLDEVLNKKNFYVPHVLENKEKRKYTKVNNKFYMIYSFLEGEPLKKLTPISSDISIKLADELRRFHDAKYGLIMF